MGSTKMDYPQNIVHRSNRSDHPEKIGGLTGNQTLSQSGALHELWRVSNSQAVLQLETSSEDEANEGEDVILKCIKFMESISTEKKSEEFLQIEEAVYHFRDIISSTLPSSIEEQESLARIQYCCNKWLNLKFIHFKRQRKQMIETLLAYAKVRLGESIDASSSSEAQRIQYTYMMIRDFEQGHSKEKLLGDYKNFFSEDELSNILKLPDRLDFSGLDDMEENDIRSIKEACEAARKRIRVQPDLTNQLPSDEFAGLSPIDKIKEISQGRDFPVPLPQIHLLLIAYHKASASLQNRGSYRWRVMEYGLLKKLLMDCDHLSKLLDGVDLIEQIKIRMKGICGKDSGVYDKASEIVEIRDTYDTTKDVVAVTAKHERFMKDDLQFMNEISKEGDANAAYCLPDASSHSREEQHRAECLRISTLIAMIQKEDFECYRTELANSPKENTLLKQICDEIESVQKYVRYTSTSSPKTAIDGKNHFHVTTRLPKLEQLSSRLGSVFDMMDFIHESTHAVIGATFNTKVRPFAFPFEDFTRNDKKTELELNNVLSERFKTADRIKNEMNLYVTAMCEDRNSPGFQYPKSELLRLASISNYMASEWELASCRAIKAWEKVDDSADKDDRIVGRIKDEDINSGAREASMNQALFQAYKNMGDIAKQRCSEHDKESPNREKLFSNTLSEYDTVINEMYYYMKEVGADMPLASLGNKPDPLFILVEQAASDALRYRQNYCQTREIKSVTTLNAEQDADSPCDASSLGGGGRAEYLDLKEAISSVIRSDDEEEST